MIPVRDKRIRPSRMRSEGAPSFRPQDRWTSRSFPAPLSLCTLPLAPFCPRRGTRPPGAALFCPSLFTRGRRTSRTLLNCPLFRSLSLTCSHSSDSLRPSLPRSCHRVHAGGIGPVCRLLVPYESDIPYADFQFLRLSSTECNPVSASTDRLLPSSGSTAAPSSSSSHTTVRKLPLSALSPGGHPRSHSPDRAPPEKAAVELCSSVLPHRSLLLSSGLFPYSIPALPLLSSPFYPVGRFCAI